MDKIVWTLVTVDEDNDVVVTVHASQEAAYACLANNFLDVSEELSMRSIENRMFREQDTVIWNVAPHVVTF